MNDKEYLNSLIRHVKRVEDNCNKLAQRFQENDEFDFALKLIKRGRIHDASKFEPNEFYHLRPPMSASFNNALSLHWSLNSHHPEHYPNGIHDMSDLDIAEMVCDCVARGQEFGSDTRVWFKTQAIVKYSFWMEDRVGQLITKYLDLLLTPPFK